MLCEERGSALNPPESTRAIAVGHTTLPLGPAHSELYGRHDKRKLARACSPDDGEGGEGAAEELHGGRRPMLDPVEAAQRDAAKWMAAKWPGTAALVQREATPLLHVRRCAVAHLQAALQGDGQALLGRRLQQLHAAALAAATTYETGTQRQRLAQHARNPAPASTRQLAIAIERCELWRRGGDGPADDVQIRKSHKSKAGDGGVTVSGERLSLPTLRSEHQLFEQKRKAQSKSYEAQARRKVKAAAACEGRRARKLQGGQSDRKGGQREPAQMQRRQTPRSHLRRRRQRPSKSGGWLAGALPAQT